MNEAEASAAPYWNIGPLSDVENGSIRKHGLAAEKSESVRSVQSSVQNQNI
jgi:hypothetical protein